MRAGWKIAVLVAAAGFTASAAAAAWLDTLFPAGVPGYGTAPGVTVASRLHPDTTPPPIRAGSVALRPGLAQSLGYDSNVLGGPAPRGSWIVATHPSLLLGSDWSRNALGAWLDADDQRDLGLPGQSRTDWTASLGVRIDLGRDLLSLAAAHVASHQDRTALDALPTDRPVPFQVDDLRASYEAAFGRWTLRPELEAASWHYGAASLLGAPASQSYRDRSVLQGGATLRYELAPQRGLVMLVRAIGQDYAHHAAGQPTLNSTGYQALAGFADDSDAVWRGRLLLGAEHRDFAAAVFRSHDAAIAEAELIWMPSGLTTVTARLTRSMEDAAQEGVAGFVATSGRLMVDHELRRDLLLHAGATLQHATFLQGDSRQTSYGLELAATWTLNRQVALSARYALTRQESAATAGLPLSGDWTRSLALLSLRLGL